MIIVSNKKLINRNKRIGSVTTIVSLAVLGLGLYISFTATSSENFTWSLLCLILGFLLSQVGIFFSSRFGRSPRPDEQLSGALKGLDDKYILYHYLTAVNHLLVGPAGLWVLIPYQLQGTITYDEKKGRWNHKGGNWYLKAFGQENLGRPDQEIYSNLQDLSKFLKKEVEIAELPEPQAVLVFSHPKAVVDAANAPAPTLPIDKLKDFMRRQAKENPIPKEPVRLLQQALPTEDIE